MRNLVSLSLRKGTEVTVGHEVPPIPRSIPLSAPPLRGSLRVPSGMEGNGLATLVVSYVPSTSREP